MVIEKKKTLLPSLTRISDSSEVREYERSFLRRYANIMRNRQNFFINAQIAARGSALPGIWDIFKNHRS